MTTDDQETNQEEKVSGSGFVRLLLTNLFETIIDTDDRNQRPRTRARSARSSNSQFDYGFAVGIGLQSAESEHDNTPETLSASASTDYAAIIHSMNEEYVTTFDLSAVDPPELSAGADSDACGQTRWRGRIARSSSARRPQSWDMSSNNCILDAASTGEKPNE